MGSGDLNRIQSKLFALNLRYAEVDQELSMTRARFTQLEAQLENARLASLIGDEAGNPAEIGPALEHVRGQLDNQQRLLQQIQNSRWETRLRYMLARREEIEHHVNQRRAEEQRSREVGGEEA
jgi:hypothetical protein